MPDCGHCSSAATSAPCARSSAAPTSRTSRVRLAISLADSIRQTASIVRWISDSMAMTVDWLLAAEDLIDTALTFAGHLPEAPRELDGFFARFGFDQGKANHGFLGLS